MSSITKAANDKQIVREVPSFNEVTTAVEQNLGGLLPQALVRLIALFTMDRFDHEIFGCRQWQIRYEAIPVTLPPLDKLRDRVHQITLSTGVKPPKKKEEMTAEECANFVHELGREEHPEPSEELYRCLNTPVRAGEKVAGLTCAVTFIPQYVRKNNRVLAVTSRTLGLELGPQANRKPYIRTDNDKVFNRMLTENDADGIQPSCYFVMELSLAPDSRGWGYLDLITRIKSQGDGEWELPEARNFIAAVFSRRVWKGEFLFRMYTFTFVQGKSPNDEPLAFGNFTETGLRIDKLELKNLGDPMIGSACSRKFLPLPKPD